MKNTIFLLTLVFLCACQKDNTAYGYDIGGKATALRTGTVSFYDNNSHWEAKTTTFPNKPVDSCENCLTLALLNGPGDDYGLLERLDFTNFPLTIRKHFLVPDGPRNGTRNKCSFNTLAGDIATGAFTVVGGSEDDFLEITEINESSGKFKGWFQVTLLTRPSILPAGSTPDTVWIENGEFTAEIPDQ
jgi:hypothetical protein